MPNRDPVDWMLSDAIETLARAERMQRQLFRLQRSEARQPALGAARRRDRDRARSADLRGPAGRGPRRSRSGHRRRRSRGRGPSVLPPELRTAVIHRLELPQGASSAASPCRQDGTTPCAASLRTAASCSASKVGIGERAMNRLRPIQQLARARPTPAGPPDAPARFRCRRCRHHPAGPKRGAVPRLIVPLGIGRPKSIAAVQQAVREERPIGIVMQRDPEVADPGPDDLYRIGTVANIVRYMTAPDGSHHVVCQGVQRMRILDFLPGTPILAARVLHLPEPEARGPEIEARFLHLQSQAVEALQLLPQAPQELIGAVQATTSPGATRRSSGRLHGHQAGGEAGDFGDGRPDGAHRQGLAPACRSASRFCA